MVRRILISATTAHLRIAITEDGKLVELFTETPDTEHHVGNIYLGRVTKIIQGMNAAFVNIGLEQDAFLHFSDVDSTMEDVATDDDEDDRPVSLAVETADVALRTSKAGSNKKLPTFTTKRSGQVTINLQAKQMVVVQVTREAYHQKGVRVTTKVGLTGRNVVLLPFEEAVGVSRKIFSVKERKRLRGIAREIFRLQLQRATVYRFGLSVAIDPAKKIGKIKVRGRIVSNQGKRALMRRFRLINPVCFFQQHTEIAPGLCKIGL